MGRTSQQHTVLGHSFVPEAQKRHPPTGAPVHRPKSLPCRMSRSVLEPARAFRASGFQVVHWYGKCAYPCVCPFARLRRRKAAGGCYPQGECRRVVCEASPANTRHRWNEVFAWLDEFCDVSRHENGDMVFEESRVRSREGRRPLRPEEFTCVSLTSTPVAPGNRRVLRPPALVPFADCTSAGPPHAFSPAPRRRLA